LAYFHQSQAVGHNLADPRNRDGFFAFLPRNNVFNLANDALADKLLGGRAGLGPHKVHITTELHAGNGNHLLVVAAGFIDDPFHLISEGLGGAAGGVLQGLDDIQSRLFPVARHRVNRPDHSIDSSQGFIIQPYF